MLKILGGCMIFSGCLGLGMWYSTQLRGRIKAVRNLRNILELLAGEIGYGRATLPECCTHTARYLHPPFDQAFCRIGERMEENMGVSFGEVFREEMEKTLSPLPLKESDREDFLAFTWQTGFMDSQMQLRAIEQSIELLRLTGEKLQQENAEKSRMAVGLGAMGGLLLILILI